MPYCAVLSCRNHSGLKNLSRGGISYHRFPNDPEIKNKWIDATGQVNWFPQKYSTICSEHFLEEDFWMSPKGNRYILAEAFPVQKIVCNVSCTEITESQAPSSSTNRPSTPTETKEGSDSETVNNSESPCSSTSSTVLSPRERKLKSNLKKAELKLKSHVKTIKLLQAQNRRLKRKISTLADALLDKSVR